MHAHLMMSTTHVKLLGHGVKTLVCKVHNIMICTRTAAKMSNQGREFTSLVIF